MKHLKTFLSSAYCLSICLASLTGLCAGHTGSAAAGLIKSYPGAKSEFEYNGALDVLCVDYETGDEYGGTINIGPDATWPEVEGNIMTLGYSASTAAQTALMALAKTAYLEAKDQFTQSRIDTLTSSVQEGFRMLDTIDLVDEVTGIKKTLSKRDKADDGMSGNVYYGPNIFNVAAAQADGKSIVSNSEDKLSLYGLPQGESDAGKIPYWGGPTLGWFYLKDVFDESSVSAKTISGSSSVENGGVGIKGWKTQSPCQADLSQMLTDPEDSADRNAHKLLCRFDTGESAVIHYLPIGEVIKIPEASVPLDDASIASNSVGNIEIKGFSTVGGSGPSIPVKVGNAIEWKPLYSADVIVRSEYNTSTHQLVNYKKTVYIVSTTESEPTEEQVQTPVFTATACPAEP